MSRWSVSVQAEGDRPVTLDEVVALADAVAPLDGIASGVGTPAYGAQIVIEALHADAAVEAALSAFADAARAAGLPDWPATRAEVVSEDDIAADPMWFDDPALPDPGSGDPALGG
ncbi:hypothetical protein [Candidatus Poriferisodalis sp.]|uniref:hypothetical protein n=1 Tax=Candidatus Poriferisodalis sp. TaxID=3101277 RepID=UPI003B022F43